MKNSEIKPIVSNMLYNDFDDDYVINIDFNDYHINLNDIITIQENIDKKHGMVGDIIYRELFMREVQGLFVYKRC